MSMGHICRRNSWLAVVACVVLAPLLGGCVTYTDHEDFLKTPRPVVGGKPYVIEPPDSIVILAPGAPEINDRSVRLRPDGYITLELLGDVFAAGKTPTQLAAEIEEEILRYYEDISVQVRVASFNSKVYYVTGETNAGPRQYTGTDTVLDAMLNAGMPSSSWPERAVVIRPNERGELIKRMTVNMKNMTERGDLKYNVVLEEGDIIYLPMNPLAFIGRQVSLLIAPVDPVIRAVSAPARTAAAPGL